MSFVYAGLIIIPIVMLALSVVVAVRKNKNGASGKKAFKSHLAVLGVMVLMMACLSFGAYAANNDNKQAEGTQTQAVQQAEEQGEEAQSKDGFAQGMGYLAAALSIGLAGIGAGLSIAGGAPAAIGATSEDPKMFGKAMIFCVLGEAIAIYGLVISFMILLV